jgi:hypothetical protein
MAFCEPKAVKTDWPTPAYVFDPLDTEFGFDLDVCATAENTKCVKYFPPTSLCSVCKGNGVVPTGSELDQCPFCNGLKQNWTGNCWMNPPYGKQISAWVEKAWKSSLNGKARVVCLLPARSNNEWWKYVIQGEVRFIRKKLQFEGATGVSMFPNVIVIFHPFLSPGGVMKVWNPDKPRKVPANG